MPGDVRSLGQNGGKLQTQICPCLTKPDIHRDPLIAQILLETARVLPGRAIGEQVLAASLFAKGSSLQGRVWTTPDPEWRTMLNWP